MDSVIVGQGAMARVELEGRVLDLPLYVTRLAEDRLQQEGVLLRQGADVAVVLLEGRELTLPLFRERGDGSRVRVRVKDLRY